jgi:hypothetical protein
MNEELLTSLDDARLVGIIPKYEATHLRHYLTDQKQYENI